MMRWWGRGRRGSSAQYNGCFFFSSRRRHTRWNCDWSSDVCSSDLFRIADDWFISVRDLRQPMLDANATVEWVLEYMGKRMDDWLHNLGDWNISRRSEERRVGKECRSRWSRYGSATKSQRSGRQASA